MPQLIHGENSLENTAGMQQAKASTFILDLILSPGTMEDLSALLFSANIIAVPVISAVVYSGVKAITNPIISAILSFSTGGRVDQPTMALIGDASRLGGRNRNGFLTIHNFKPQFKWHLQTLMQCLLPNSTE